MRRARGSMRPCGTGEGRAFDPAPARRLRGDRPQYTLLSVGGSCAGPATRSSSPGALRKTSGPRLRLLGRRHHRPQRRRRAGGLGPDGSPPADPPRGSSLYRNVLTAVETYRTPAALPFARPAVALVEDEPIIGRLVEVDLGQAGLECRSFTDQRLLAACANAVVDVEFVHPRAGQISAQRPRRPSRPAGLREHRLGLVAGGSPSAAAADFDCILASPSSRRAYWRRSRRALTAAAGWPSEGALGLARSVGGKSCPGRPSRGPARGDLLGPASRAGVALRSFEPRRD